MNEEVLRDQVRVIVRYRKGEQTKQKNCQVFMPDNNSESLIEQIVDKHLMAMAQELLRATGGVVIPDDGTVVVQPTPMIKGIVIAGRHSEYRRWIEEGCHKVDEYPLVTSVEQLRSLQGHGLTCHFVGSYVINGIYSVTVDIELLVHSRGFKCIWE